MIFFDALRAGIRDESVVKNKAIYPVLALDCEGHKHVLGLWIEQIEGAKFWLRIMNELKNRGIDDVLFAVVDGLKGFPDPITAVFPNAIGHDLHCPPDTPQPGLRVLAGPQAPAASAGGDLSGRDRGGRQAAARRLRSRVGQEVSGDRPGVAARLE